VSQDGGRDEPMEQKLIFVIPFFCLKISRFKAMVHRVAHPDVKTSSSDPAGFATTWIPIWIFFIAFRGHSL
jgi:hypothetical protein